MKVKDLIKRLKKFDQEAVVVWRSHDQSDHEIDGYIRYVSDGPEEMLQNEQEESIVVLSP